LSGSKLLPFNERKALKVSKALKEFLVGFRRAMKSTEQLPVVRLNPVVKQLFLRSINLFFFYQKSEPL
jgi:hypothetical protein